MADFCVHKVVRLPGGTPYVTLVATTTKLQRRATATPCGTAGIDGGHGFCLLGWPMLIKGEINNRGQLGPTELMLCSTMDLMHVREAVGQAAESAARVSKRPSHKQFTMSDAEVSLRNCMQVVHGSHPLMCWFHVVQATRDYVFKHAQLTLEARRMLFTRNIRPDLWCLHRSLCKAEFASKVIAVLAQWEAIGANKATHHVDAKGISHTLSSYFSRQWVGGVPDWYVGCSPLMPMITTNNAVESKIKYTRDLAGGTPAGAIAVGKFMLAQVRSWAEDEFDPSAERPIEKELWQRASEFKTLFGTNKVHRASVLGEILYACWERNGALDVAARQPMTKEQALQLISIRSKLRGGQPVSHADLQVYQSGRIFGQTLGKCHCTCPAFVPWQRCLHTLGFQLKHDPAVSLPPGAWLHCGRGRGQMVRGAAAFAARGVSRPDAARRPVPLLLRRRGDTFSEVLVRRP